MARDAIKLLQISGQAVDALISAVRSARNEQIRDSNVERCKEYIKSHLFRKIDIKKMSDELEISYSYLDAKFHKSTGMSIKQYILEKNWKRRQIN